MPLLKALTSPGGTGVGTAADTVDEVGEGTSVGTGISVGEEGSTPGVEGEATGTGVAGVIVLEEEAAGPGGTPRGPKVTGKAIALRITLLMCMEASSRQVPSAALIHGSKPASVIGETLAAKLQVTT